MEVIWNIALWGSAVFFIAFTFVIAFGAPFLPTLKQRIPDALDLINLRSGQTLIELGSGDGRLLKAAAERGIVSVGYELNPLLVVYSKIATLKYRRLVTIRWGNFWNQDWPPADGIFVFLLQPYMEKLNAKITQTYPSGVKLVSFAFTIPGKKPHRIVNGMYLYNYGKQLKKKSR
jgi:hypothetical protein